MLKIWELGDNASIVFLNIICADNSAAAAAQNEEKFSTWKMDFTLL